MKSGRNVLTFQRNTFSPSSESESKPNKELANHLLLTDFMIGLFFDPEDGASVFLRNNRTTDSLYDVTPQKIVLFTDTALRT